MYKTCSRCNITKAIEFFAKRKKSKDGYYGVCRDCRNDDVKKSKSKKVYSMEEILLEKERKKLYYINNKDRILLKSKEYRDNNKESARIYKNKYYYENREKLIEYSCKYHTNRIKNDELYKFKCSISNLIKNSLKYKGYKKNSKTEEILGLNILEFFKYIESKFEPWMTWENYGNFDGNIGKFYNHSWTIDHIIPVHTAKNEEEILKLNHYTNLQPLCGKINMYIKRGRLDFK